MNNIKLFEGQEVKVKTDKGATLINLVHVAKCCGLVRKNNSGQGVKIRWDDIKKKANPIKVEGSTPQKIKEEITYILEEIENTDDRNSIYMSSWLSKRLALECHSEKANRFKNFLVTLDEEREKGNLVNSGQIEQIAYLAENMQVMGHVVQGLQTFTLGLKEYVQDSIQAKDKQIDDIAEMIGFRTKNTRTLTDKLKYTLKEKYDMRSINSNMEVYKKAKSKIFDEFKVSKWEDIPVIKYNSVATFIEECITHS
ncbi:hypothetical protein CLPUN_38070 [Clostridium puniceum]|uniref:Uncharacterized protein n=1 Tax=Clostridium puniceum TaxID=29367 RepID=A0A1S8T9Y3_9CLOT|nr:hypothetical protein [Clostridium puniceum]OOM74566.1 hypothetical protein CLPUN_38070 [Clostridium puniceum]